MRTFYKTWLVIAIFITSLNSIAQSFTSSVRQFITDSAKIIALVDAKIIDGTGGPSKANQTVIIMNGHIAQTGKVKDVVIPKGASVINCTGKTIIPGMVMLHEHLYYTMLMGGYFNVAEMPYSFPRMYLAGGATTIRTGGSIETQTDLNIKQMITEGKLPGPDMDVTAPYIERKAWDIPSVNIIRDSAEAAATVNFWADKGCTSFKMYVHAKKEDLIAVVREAHKRNLKVTGHIGTITYREAAELGIDDLEHGFFVSSDFDKDKKENEYDEEKASRTFADLPVNSAEMKSLIEFLISKHVAVTSTLPV